MELFTTLLIYFVLAGGFVATLLFLSIAFGPRKHSEAKDDPFECGTKGIGSPTERFSVRFYLVAITFVLFDLEAVFLIPWALTLKELGQSGPAVFLVMVPFLVMLAVGLLYEWKQGVLDWA